MHSVPCKQRRSHAFERGLQLNGSSAVLHAEVLGLIRESFRLDEEGIPFATLKEAWFEGTSPVQNYPFKND